MPADRSAAADSTDGSRLGLRLLAFSALLLALPFPSNAGFEAQNTKLDLTINPDGLLFRSLTLWDSLGSFGQVGNQSYGYLWPMGPFFWLGDLANMPGWVVQRLWIGLVLVVAFQGAARLARELGVRHDLAIIVGALAYALSPRIVTTVGPIGIEAWPSALAPWVLLALVIGSRRGSARRYALGAALGIAAVGGVNAAATFATIPVGAVWLLTRTKGPRRRSLMLWWPVFTALTCLWWLAPLAVLGRYSPPFLDYIETAQITTFPTNLFSSLRGTTAWIPYVESAWQAGSEQITTPAIILNGVVMIVLGLLGISLRSNPHRVFLSLSLLLGLLMVTFGHTVGLSGVLADQQTQLLDGALAPFRNVHKFDPVIRIPMVLGLAHVLDLAVTAWRERSERETATSRLAATQGAFSSLSVVGLVIVALAGATVPAWSGQLMAKDGYEDVPGYWRDAAAWLGEDPTARSMLLPSSDFGAYVWGTTQDEPLQPLAEAPWSVRGAMPLVPIGNVRMLDAIEERISRGEGSAALTNYFRRVGITYLVVRNDLERNDDIADPTLVHQALAESPGIEFAQGFGPIVGGEPRVDNADGSLFVNGGWQDTNNAIEIFEVSEPPAPASKIQSTPIVVGAPEDVLTLTELGVLGTEPTQLGYDADPTETPAGPVLLTDGLRLRDRFFGRQHDGHSPTLTPAEAADVDDLRDYEVTSDEDWFTVASLEGVAGVSASSSLSDARALGGSRVDRAPFSAVDGDPATEWTSRAEDTDTPFVRVDLEERVRLDRVVVTAGASTAPRTVLRVRTAAGASAEFTVDPGDEVPVAVPSGATEWVQVEHGSGRADHQISIADLAIPGVNATRWLRTPRLPEAWGAPSVIALDAAADARDGCAWIDGSLRCRLGAAYQGEEPTAMRRVVDLPLGGEYAVAASAVGRDGVAVQQLLEQDLLVSADASSVSVPGVSAAGAFAAIDGNPGTTWISSPFDEQPSVTIRWIGPQRIRGIELTVDDTIAGRTPRSVIIGHGEEEQTVTLDGDGNATVEPFTASSVTITVKTAENGANLDFAGDASNVGVAISELRFPGAASLPVPLSQTSTDFGCGSGPTLVAGADWYETSVLASPLELHLGQAVALRPCGLDSVTLDAGENRLQLIANSAFSPASMVLTRTNAVPLAPVTDADVGGTTVQATTDDEGVMVLRHNVNPGWHGTAGGLSLEAVTIDGWQQGYVVPDGASRITSTFAPGGSYRWGLAIGGVCLLIGTLLYGWWRWREPRDERAPLLESGLARRLVLPAWLAGVLIVTGWAGLSVAAATLLALALLGRREDLRLWIGFLPVVVVGAWHSFQPWGGTSEWAGERMLPQLLMVVPLALLAYVVAGAPSLRNLIKGRSTKR